VTSSREPSLPHGLDHQPLPPLAVELGIEDLLPGPEIELARGDGDDDLVVNQQVLQVRVAIVLATPVMASRLTTRGSSDEQPLSRRCPPHEGTHRRHIGAAYGSPRKSVLDFWGRWPHHSYRSNSPPSRAPRVRPHIPPVPGRSHLTAPSRPTWSRVGGVSRERVIGAGFRFAFLRFEVGQLLLDIRLHLKRDAVVPPELDEALDPLESLSAAGRRGMPTWSIEARSPQWVCEVIDGSHAVRPMFSRPPRSIGCRSKTPICAKEVSVASLPC